MGEKKYDCVSCANRGTLFCGKCTAVTTTDGEEGKPSWFCDINKRGASLSGSPKEGAAMYERAIGVIAESMQGRTPIPVRAVLAYNAIIELYGTEEN